MYSVDFRPAPTFKLEQDPLLIPAQSARAVEYINYIYAEG